MHCALINVTDAALADIACEETHTGVSPAGDPLSSMPEMAALVRIVKNLTGKSFISFSNRVNLLPTDCLLPKVTLGRQLENKTCHTESVSTHLLVFSCCCCWFCSV